MAIGTKAWGEMAMNLCLSVKANYNSAKMFLIYESEAISDIPIEVINQYFDYTICVDNYTEYKGHEKAFYIKTELYNILTLNIELSRFLFIDADCLLTLQPNLENTLNNLENSLFQTWCNAYYDFDQNKDYSKGYTYWCDPKKMTLSGKLPQLNTSFIYFERRSLAKDIFKKASEIWHRKEVDNKKYKGVMPDEYCFNMACLELKFMPQIEYKPIFFQFAHEYQNANYVLHKFTAFGFAGEHIPSKWFVHLYNELSNYYREYFGVKSWTYKPSMKNFDKGKIRLKYADVLELSKAGDLPNSDGGIFNPDGKIVDGKLIVLARKEKNFDAYKNKYTLSTAIPCVNFDLDLNVSLGYRIEDFRAFVWNSELWSGFSCVGKESTWIGISKLKYLGSAMQRIYLPIKTEKIEKNWVFFEHNSQLCCIYSLQPYRLFFYMDDSWNEYEGLKKLDFDWFHKGHPICNSTNPIDIGAWYLTMFHTKENGIYFHGACLIDKETLQIAYYTKNSIHIIDEAKGLHDDLIYVSGSVYLERQQIVRIYFGAADFHSMRIDFNRDELVEAIIKNHNS